jgi:hypothetical protein
MLWESRIFFDEEGIDSDFEDEGNSSLSSSTCEEINLDMLHDLDLLYFESQMMRNNIYLFEYTYGQIEKRHHHVTHSCPPILENENKDIIIV